MGTFRAVGGDKKGPSLGASSALTLEFHLDQLAVLLGHFEHSARFQAHEAGHKNLRDLADASVVGINVVIEELAPVSDALFQFADARLQLEKVFVGLELRVILRDGK